MLKDLGNMGAGREEGRGGGNSLCQCGYILCHKDTISLTPPFLLKYLLNPFF